MTEPPVSQEPVAGPPRRTRANDVRVRPATPEDAPEVYRLVVAAFRARPALDPPADALSETPDSIASEITARGGLVATRGGAPVGSLMFGTGPGLRLTRVSVDPAQRRQRIAARLVRSAEAVATARGESTVSLVARRELSSNGAFWRSLGYGEVDPSLFPPVDRRPHNLTMARAVPFTVPVAGAAAMRRLGRRLGALLTAGDLVLLTGDLGAGKTTLTQGIAAGLGVRGPVTSPTFVIAREHPSLAGGPPLVHVDGYRLDGAPELDDLDLDSAVADSVTVVEWGRGIAEALASDRVEITIDRDASRRRATAPGRSADLDPSVRADTGAGPAAGGPAAGGPAAGGPAAGGPAAGDAAAGDPAAEPDAEPAAGPDADPSDELRTVRVEALGGRWAFAGLEHALGRADQPASLG